ncbi:enoyl-CoA hydratase/isomerase family protein [Paraburkholderia nemoris]|uniref:3-hydroxyisobutyryl-CoA hydrolase n=1 Tax=Paraburkholderia nemoris TaxID=2793076 RepID=A0ABM8QYI8_9BURK|nr:MULTISPECIES: enoyl-CoA hydratase/isomerase family protein [Paraburkholderia]MBK3810084.1 enoyl-CoA hydratase/isomerase family protein [Paraburkholderia aspalathi]CAE6723402.1 1,4-dihydroxy-2-naphthoyl-CoA synthase [Paraburkholderia nemoris]CAE6749678.1 1,4-dihydroxy-2-naphthoyl-CoA synthase [Paraburkholderia nemoris]
MDTENRIKYEREIDFEVINRVAVVTLNRPRALNALSHEMVRRVTDVLELCRHEENIAGIVFRGAGDKAFCVGGDVRALYESVCSDRTLNEAWLQFFIDEYRLDYAIHHFEKPIVALMDGIVMGGGMGLAQGAALRIVTERTRLAMPETRIGMVPDVGATYFMRVMPLEIELYAGLTGASLTGPDAVAYGFADFCVPSTDLRNVGQYLESVDWSASLSAKNLLRDALVRTTTDPTEAPLKAHSAKIRSHFGMASSAQSIVAGLHNGEQTVWSTATHEALAKCSPCMLEVTYRALRMGRDMSLADCFRMELGIVHRTISEGDFLEGVRALIVDKDHRPRWRPASFAKLDSARVTHFLTSPWKQDQHPLAELGV